LSTLKIKRFELDQLRCGLQVQSFQALWLQTDQLHVITVCPSPVRRSKPVCKTARTAHHRALQQFKQSRAFLLTYRRVCSKKNRFCQCIGAQSLALARKNYPSPIPIFSKRCERTHKLAFGFSCVFVAWQTCSLTHFQLQQTEG